MFDDDGMEEIKQIFLEESLEGLDIMESGLLNLESGVGDIDTINDVFRAAHSLKGGGGTFGFTEISEFTHGVETILDEMRDQVRDATEATVSVLLECVDCLRGMLDCIRDGSEYDTPRIEELGGKIQYLLDNPDSNSTDIPTVSSDDTSQGEATATATAAPEEEKTPDIIETAVLEPGSEGHTGGYWLISFSPMADVLSTGNEPYRIFRTLETLGELEIEANIEKLPAFNVLTVDQCYLSWTLKLTAECKKQNIEEMFEWVAEQADINIEYISQSDVSGVSDHSAEKTSEHVVETTPTVETKAPETAAVVEHTTKPDTAAAVKKPESPAEEKKPVPKPAAKKPAARKPEGGSNNAETSSIRVSTDKIDNLLDLVGELVITQSMLARFAKEYTEENIDELRDGLVQLEQNTRELQESSMQIRMLPIKVVFSRFPRLLRDLTGKLKKKIKLVVEGETTELDKIVMEKIGDPLVHLVRNSIDHGIEIPEVRKAAGKPEVGILTLVAYQEARNIVIEVKDDGAGINKERVLKKAMESGLVQEDDHLTDDQINHLIFAPGFSTADVVSDISGRGVGMDVVKRNIQDIGGRVEVVSEEGVGSTFTIRLPLTLAILEGQLVKAGSEIYVIPVLTIIESILIKQKNLSLIGNDVLVYHFREEYIAITDLRDSQRFNQKCDVNSYSDMENSLLVVCDCDGKKMGVVVDELSDQQQVVIKSLDVNYKNVIGLSGGTILGDGRVALIIDPIELRASCFAGTEITPAIQEIA